MRGGVRDREVVEVVHAVLLVGERPVLAEHRVGMIARGLEAGGAQLGADGARAGEALLRLRVAPRDEQREARELVGVAQIQRSRTESWWIETNSAAPAASRVRWLKYR